MKWKILLVLFAFVLSVTTPPSLPWLADNGQEAAIGTLDLCHAGSPAVTGNGDMPCIQECPCHPLPLVMISVSELPHTSFEPLLIAFQDERPPQT
jgi:hypothetical protein